LMLQGNKYAEEDNWHKKDSGTSRQAIGVSQRMPTSCVGVNREVAKMRSKISPIYHTARPRAKPAKVPARRVTRLTIIEFDAFSRKFNILVYLICCKDIEGSLGHDKCPNIFHSALSGFSGLNDHTKRLFVQSIPLSTRVKLSDSQKDSMVLTGRAMNNSWDPQSYGQKRILEGELQATSD
jgi:hypothetical protein